MPNFKQCGDGIRKIYFFFIIFKSQDIFYIALSGYNLRRFKFFNNVHIHYNGIFCITYANKYKFSCLSIIMTLEINELPCVTRTEMAILGKMYIKLLFPATNSRYTYSYCEQKLISFYTYIHIRIGSI